MDQLNRILENKYVAWLLCGLFLAAGVALAIFANGTCDSGDSVMHYQYARWSWAHPELMFNHWAKPLFVLLASPAAQGGIVAMKLFNVAISFAAIVCTYYIASALHIKRKVFAVVAIIFSPSLIVHSLSGLTEPMFALALAAGILLYLRNRVTASILIVSFMPFIRSEGLIICGVFGLLLLIERRWFTIPLLALGHIIYGIAGLGIYGSVWWVFTKVPYARLSSVYGKGTWSHFFVNLPFITGIPLCLLLVAGMLYGLYLLVNKPAWKQNARHIFLIYGVFVSFFAAHVIFWALGIFNSFGLMRVLVGVLPVMAIIQLHGLNSILQFVKPIPWRNAVAIILVALVAIYSFTGHKYAWHYKRDFLLNPEQQMQQDMVDYIKANYPDYKEYRYYFDANYVSVALDFDYFDTTKSLRLWQDWEVPPTPKSFMIWDEWYSAVEMNYPLETAEKDYRIKRIKDFVTHDEWGYEKRTVLFKFNPPPTP